MRFVLLGLCGVMSVVGWGCRGQTRVEDKDVRQVIYDYVRGADVRDLRLIQSSLHRESRQYVVLKQKLTPLSKALYLKLINDKKIGGIPRQVEIHDVKIVGAMASAHVTMLSKKIRFETFLGLMRVGGRWRILSSVMNVKYLSAKAS